MAKKILTKWYTFQREYWTLFNKYLQRKLEEGKRGVESVKERRREWEKKRRGEL